MKKISRIFFSISMFCCAFMISTLPVQAAKSSKTTSISNVKAKGTTMIVKWKKKSGVTGYQIQYSTNSKFKKNNKTVRVKKYKTTSTTVKKLKSGKKYYVRIRTYKGKKTSKWSKTKICTMKNASTKSTTSSGHKHNWVDHKITTQEEVIVTPAVRTQKYYIQCGCGEYFPTSDEYSIHFVLNEINGDKHHRNYMVEEGTTFVKTPAKRKTVTKVKTDYRYCTICGAHYDSMSKVYDYIVSSKLSTPSIEKITPLERGFSLNWYKNSDIDGYQIQYSTSSDFSKNNTITRVSNRYSGHTDIENLADECTYYVRMRTYKGNSCSNWSQKKSMKTKHWSVDASKITFTSSKINNMVFFSATNHNNVPATVIFELYYTDPDTGDVLESNQKDYTARRFECIGSGKTASECWVAPELPNGLRRSNFNVHFRIKKVEDAHKSYYHDFSDKVSVSVTGQDDNYTYIRFTNMGTPADLDNVSYTAIAYDKDGKAMDAENITNINIPKKGNSDTKKVRFYDKLRGTFVASKVEVYPTDVFATDY